MPKKSATSSTGTTVNPVPPPAAPPAPPAPATAPARKPSTAGPLPVAAASDAPDYESAFTTDLTSLIGSDEPTTPPAPALREPQAKTRTADKTPVEDEADAEGSDTHTDEEAADAETPTGEPTLEDDSPEPEATADEAHAEDAAEDADEEGEEHRNLPGSVKRRFKKFTKKVDALETELDKTRRENDELRAKLESTKPAPPMVNGVPVSEEETELRGEMSNVDDWLNWFEQNPAGGTRKLQDGSTVAYDAIGADQARQQLQQMRVQKAAELGVIQRLNRKRAEQEHRQAEQEVAQVLSQRYPWTKDKTNPSAQAIENALRQHPALRSVPHVKVWMASHLALEALLKQQQKPAANGNGHSNGHAAPAPRPAPRAPGRPAAAPAALNGRQTAVRVSEKAFFENTDSPQADSFLTSLVEGR